MTLKSCAPIVGVDVMSFDAEKDVLLAWRVKTFLLLFGSSIFILIRKSGWRLILMVQNCQIEFIIIVVVSVTIIISIIMIIMIITVNFKINK